MSTPPARGATLNRVYLALPINFPAIGPPAAPSPIATNTAVRELITPQFNCRIQLPCLFPQSTRMELIIPAAFCDSSTVLVATENLLSGTEALIARGIPEALMASLASSGSLSNSSFERWMSFSTTVPMSRKDFRGMSCHHLPFEGDFCYVLVSGWLITKSNIKTGLGHKGEVH